MTPISLRLAAVLLTACGAAGAQDTSSADSDAARQRRMDDAYQAHQTQGSADDRAGGTRHAAAGSVREGARATGHAVHHAATATGHAFRDGARATGHGIRNAAHATGHAIHQGVRATGHAIHHGVNKLTGNE